MERIESALILSIKMESQKVERREMDRLFWRSRSVPGTLAVSER